MTWKRVYTEKSYKTMLTIRSLILILTSPIWLPLYLFIVIAYKVEYLLDYLDNLLQKILDKLVPQKR